MASRPFARRHKDGGKEADFHAPNVIEEFFAAEPAAEGSSATEGSPPDEARGSLVVAPQVPDATPEVQLPDDAQAGWYPDATNPGLMRYWDGFHLTGQVLHVHARAGDADEAEAAAKSRQDDRGSTGSLTSTDRPAPAQSIGTPFGQPRALTGGGGKVTGGSPPSAPLPADAATKPTPAAAATSNPARPFPRQLGDNGATRTAAHRPGQVKGPEDGGATGSLVAALGQDDAGVEDDKDDNGGLDDAATRRADSAGRSTSAQGDDEIRNWAAMTETAVARAKAVGTPEAWKQAAQAAIVVSEMAQTMQVAAEATQLAQQKTRAAEEAEREARVATQAETEAKEVVRETSKAAQAAADAAKVAVQGATEAEQRAQELKDIVATAHEVNTPEAWRKALQLVANATGATSRSARRRMRRIRADR